MALPTLFLALALAPPPRLLNEALWWIQSLSARAATALVQATGAPLLGESIALSTPTVVFAIVESCAALGVLLILTAAAVLVRERIADIGRRSWLLVLLAPVVAVALNLARITTIVLHPPLNELHHLWQWAILLSLGGLTLAAIAALLARSSAATELHGEPSAFAAPLPPALAIAGLAGLAALSLIPVSEPITTQVMEEPSRSVPAEHAGWRSRDLEIDRSFLGFVQFRETIARRYERDGLVVELFVGDAYQRSEWSSPFSPKTILLGFHWVPVPIADEGLSAELVPGPDQTALVARERQRWWVAQWRFGDPGIIRQSLRQLFALDASPFAAPRPRRVVRIAAPVDLEDADGISGAQTAIARFVRDFETDLFGESS
jgi:exosortase/archaeosortase family protein